MSNWRSTISDPPPLDVYVLIKTKGGLVRVAKRLVYPDNTEEYRYSSQGFKQILWWQPLPI
jgi:hypothetical protein